MRPDMVTLFESAGNKEVAWRETKKVFKEGMYSKYRKLVEDEIEAGLPFLENDFEEFIWQLMKE